MRSDVIEFVSTEEPWDKPVNEALVGFSLQFFKSIYLPVINTTVEINIEKSPKTDNQIK
jgi:hypothetical protein